MKKLVIICTILIIFIFGAKVVNAKAITNFSNGEVTYLANNMTEDNCTSLLGKPTNEGDPAYYLQKGLDIIKYLGVILCIVLTIVDFAKAIFSNDKDMLKPLSKKALSRLIYAVLLFFLPIIVKTLLTLVGAYSTCGIQ